MGLNPTTICPHCKLLVRAAGAHAHIARCQIASEAERRYYALHRTWPKPGIKLAREPRSPILASDRKAKPDQSRERRHRKH